MSKRLNRAIREVREHMNLNYGRDDGEDWDDEDALDELMSECGQDSSGLCSKAGSEECDWECPFSN